MTQNDRKIRDLATIFWDAVKDVQDAGGFDDDETFRAFPEQCCGETCMLLAEFLRTNRIETIYVLDKMKARVHMLGLLLKMKESIVNRSI